MLRSEVLKFVELGPLPSGQDDSEEGDEAFDLLERSLHAIEKPVSDAEAELHLRTAW